MLGSVRESIETLESNGELVRVHDLVSPLLVIAALADHESKSPAARAPGESAQRNDPLHCSLGGRAMLFERVEGADMPVLINAYGSYSRMETLLGCARFATSSADGFEAIAARIAALVKPEPPRGLHDLLRAGKRFAPLLRAPPRRVRSGPCQEIVHKGSDVDLTMLPLLRCWPLDGDLPGVGYPADCNAGVIGADLGNDERYMGRYITFGHVHTIHPDDRGKSRPASHNVGMYRVQLVGRRTLAMHWHMHHDGASHWRAWKASGERMPIAIALGGESVLPFASIAPLPPGVSELLFAGFMQGKGVRMCPARTVPLQVPANAEIVIEGWVDTRAGLPGFDPRVEGVSALGVGAFFEGPFGDHTGFYSLPDRYPLVDVTAITMRRNPIFPATVVGLPPQEDYFMGKGVERLFLPLLRTLIPDIIEYDLPMFGAFHNCAVLQIRKEYPLQARRVMHAVWGAGQMAWTKCVIVVDGDVNVHDHREVLKALAERCRLDRDVERVEGPLDILDHSAPYLGAGGKIGFDATKPIAGEELPAVSGRSRGAASIARTNAACEDPAIEATSTPASLGNMWKFVQVSAAQPAGREAVEREMDIAPDDQPRIVIAVGPDANIDNPEDALFHWLAHCDPGRDALWSADGLRIGFDATPKSPGKGHNDRPTRDWPPILRMHIAPPQLD